MKKLIVFTFVNICLFSITLRAQNFASVGDGIEYAELERIIDKLPVKMNLLRLDLTKVRLDVVHAMDAAIGTEMTSSMAIRHGAIAAINAGFFRLDRSVFSGENVSLLMIDGKLLSESNGSRVTLSIDNNTPNGTKVFINRLSVTQSVSIGGKKFEVSGINRQRGENDLIIYTPEFNRTTLTNRKGLELVVRRSKILTRFDERGSVEIPSDGFVISASGKFREQLLPLVRRNAGVTVNQHWDTMNALGFPKITQVEDIISGVPQLIKNGKIEITWQEEKSSKPFVETRHPRTAVAKLKDGKFLMITVDGRSEVSGGIGLQNLAEMLLEFGAIDAMNLDGGGSTTMVLNGKIVNKPSDKEGERRVGDAILVFPRQKNQSN